MVNSERVRKDVSHKLAAAKNKCTTEFDIRINDMVSYKGAAVKILDLLHPSKHGYRFSKAIIYEVFQFVNEQLVSRLHCNHSRWLSVC